MSSSIDYLIDKYGLTMDVNAVAQELHVTRRWLEKQRSDPRGSFPRPSRLGRGVRYITHDIIGYLERQRAAG